MHPPKPSNEDLGAALRQLRKHQELTIEALADRSGVHGTYVSLIERGQANPTWDVITAITCALGTGPSTLALWAEGALQQRTRSDPGSTGPLAELP